MADKSKKKKMAAKAETDVKIDRARIVLDNLVRAVETGDMTAMEQAAGAGREFLDQNPA